MFKTYILFQKTKIILYDNSMASTTMLGACASVIAHFCSNSMLANTKSKVGRSLSLLYPIVSNCAFVMLLLSCILNCQEYNVSSCRRSTPLHSGVQLLLTHSGQQLFIMHDQNNNIIKEDISSFVCVLHIFVSNVLNKEEAVCLSTSS